MTKKEWKKLAKLFRTDHRLPGVHYRINERTRMAEEMRHCTVFGILAQHIAGMDCDSVKYHRSTNREPMPLIIEWWETEQEYKWADGPMDIWYTKPCMPVSESRDLGTEAWENGHQHIIYA